MKSYGRPPTLLLAFRYEQVRSIAAALAGDAAAAERVELDLPQTGDCSTDIGDPGGRTRPPVRASKRHLHLAFHRASDPSPRVGDLDPPVARRPGSRHDREVILRNPAFSALPDRDVQRDAPSFIDPM